MNVLLDSREPGHVKKLFKEFYPDGEIRLLESGDLVCPKYNVCIERKVNSDFVGSVMGTSESPGRIWEQVERMESTYNHNYIILIGDYDDLPDEDKNRFTKEMWVGSQISLMARHNIKFITVKTNREFFKIAHKIFEKSDGVKKDRCNIRKVTKNDKAVVIGSLYQVPNIGIKQSTAIVNHFNIHRVSELCELSMEDYMKVPKIGRVKAEKIKEHF